MYRRLGIAVTIFLAVLFLPIWVSGEKGESRDHASTGTDEPKHEWHGSYGGPGSACTKVARNAMDWQTLWAMVSAEPPVTFDPIKTMAVGIFLGTRRTGGYWVEIISAREENGVFVVEYMEITPGANDIVTQALTTPYLIRVFPKKDLKVIFKTLDPPQLIDRLTEEQMRSQALEKTLKEKESQLEKTNVHVWRLEGEISSLKARNRELQETLQRIRRALPPGGWLPVE